MRCRWTIPRKRPDMVFITRRRATCVRVLHTSSSTILSLQRPGVGLSTIDRASLPIPARFACSKFWQGGAFSDYAQRSMFAMHPPHVMGIQPLNHSHARMFAPVTARQRHRNDCNRNKAHYPTNHRLSHGSLLEERNHDCILVALGLRTLNSCIQVSSMHQALGTERDVVGSKPAITCRRVGRSVGSIREGGRISTYFTSRATRNPFAEKRTLLSYLKRVETGM